MRFSALIAVAAVALAGCEDSRVSPGVSVENEPNQGVTTSDPKWLAGKVIKYAVAPDGTTLWVVRNSVNGDPVFFSSHGTQTVHSETDGENTIEVVDAVPSAQ